MSVPESIAWLETTAHTKPSSAAQIYATTLLGELERLSRALDHCAREVENRERIFQEERGAHREREVAFDALEERARLARDEWDAARIELGGRLDQERAARERAETMLKDVHFALLKQPELTREKIASTITSVVTPYPKGAKS